GRSCASRRPRRGRGCTGSRAGCARSSSAQMRLAPMDPDDLREDARAALDSRLVPSPGLEARVLALLDAGDRPSGQASAWQRQAGLIALLLTVVVAGSLALWWRSFPRTGAEPAPRAAGVQLAQFSSGGAGWVISTRFTGRTPSFVVTVD